MRTVAGYEVLKEIYRDGSTTVCHARRDGGDPRFVIKVFRPFMPASKEAEEAAMRSFIARCSLQNELARSSRHWLPIHDCGPTGEAPVEAYCVSDFFPGSVAKLIFGRVKLTEASLRGIVRAVLAGLRCLDDAEGREHGNLKPENVLISGRLGSRCARVVLSDPAASPSPGDRAGHRDLPALGAIIRSLVLHCPFGLSGGVTGDSPEWAELGASGDAWRRLCSKLLAAESDIPLRDVEETVASLGPRSKRRGRRCLAVAVCVLLVSGSAAALFHPAAQSIPVVSSVRHEVAAVAAWAADTVGRLRRSDGNTEWVNLCEQYAAWFGNVSHLGDVARAQWEGDSHLAGLLRVLDDASSAGVEHDPRRIADAPASNLQILKESPPRSVMRGNAAKNVKLALETVQTIAEGLSPGAWPLCGRMDRIADVYEQRGWGRPAGYLRSLVLRMRSPLGPTSVLTINSMLDAESDIIEIDSSWTQYSTAVADAMQAASSSDSQAALRVGQTPTGEGGDLSDMANLRRLLRDACARSTDRIADGKPLGGVEQELRQIRDPTVTGSPVLVAAWEQRRNEVIAAGQLPSDMRQSADRLHAFLAELDWAVPVSPVLPVAGEAGNWTDPELAALWDKRETLLQTVLAAVDWHEGRPRLSAEELLAEEGVFIHLEAYGAWRRALRAER